VILAGLVGLAFAFGNYGAEQERRGKSVAIEQQRPGEREILDRADSADGARYRHKRETATVPVQRATERA
jgi:hypothetical protein